MHEGVKGGEDAVSLHDIFAPQADLGAALHPVKGDAVDRRGFGVGLVAAVDIGTLVAAEDDAEVVTLEHTGYVAAAGVNVLAQLAMEGNGNGLDGRIERAGMVQAGAVEVDGHAPVPAGENKYGGEQQQDGKPDLAGCPYLSHGGALLYSVVPAASIPSGREKINKKTAARCAAVHLLKSAFPRIY